MLFTVGGAHQPIVRSIKENKPDRVYFICSSDSEGTKGSYMQIIGQGNVLKSSNDRKLPDLPNIATLCGLEAAQFEIVMIDDFDNLEKCYVAAASLIDRLHKEYPGARIIADYTGGTKSMTAGLAAAALDDGQCEIQLVTGVRQDLMKVLDKSEFVRPVHVWNLQISRRLNVAKALISRYDYAGAGRIIEEAASRFAGDDTIEVLRRWVILCRAFDAWDKFDHEEASRLLQPYRKNFVDHARFLDAILGGKAAHGFELVEDLVLNAERRAAQGRFDDAVGRLYRALELMAQKWLELKHGIATGDLKIAKVPAHCAEEVSKLREEDGKIRIGLWKAWNLISCFKGDPLGFLFDKRKGEILNFLSVRNESLFAHGVRPISENDYSAHSCIVKQFIDNAIDKAIEGLGRKRAVKPQQLPTEWE
ncbi:MAG: TIGR02710 family CRISPR-associated CARF protein [Candidatus Methanomethylicaceae archaeon]